MIGGDRTLHVMMAERGELDAVYQIQLPDIFRLKRDPRLRDWVKMIDSAMTDFLVLNTELPPFNNSKVREAISHAINKERLVSLMGGSAVVAKGILPPLMPGYNAELKGAEYNPELARRLLAEAGYPNGITFELSYTDDDPRWGRGAIAIEQDLSAVGARVTLIKLTLPVLYTAVQTRKRLPCAYLGWAQDYPDPSNFLDVLFNGTRIQEVGGNNFAYYNNPDVNEMLAMADRTLVANERYRLYQEVEKQILLDAPVVPLTHRATPMLISGRIDGYLPHPVWTITPECWWRTQKE
jgi:oligopeptide transport system substrate-binding protein